MTGRDWRERIRRLKDIDWSKQNKDWEGICIVANSVVSNQQARAVTRAYIKSKLGMSLTESEVRALPASQVEAAEWPQVTLGSRTERKRGAAQAAPFLFLGLFEIASIS